MKAILVLDVPDYIQDITKVKLAYGLYVAKNDELDPTDILEFHQVYPLKELPQKIEHSEQINPFCEDYEDEYDYWYKEGYNACIDEILGEK